MAQNHRPAALGVAMLGALALLVGATETPASAGVPRVLVPVRHAVYASDSGEGKVYQVGGGAYPFSMQAAAPYPFSYHHGQYPFGAYHGRYPLGYYLGGYRYPFSYPYYSYGLRDYPTQIGSSTRGYGGFYSVYDYGDPGYMGTANAPVPGYGGYPGYMPNGPYGAGYAPAFGQPPFSSYYGGW